MRIVGIDPGQSGGIAILEDGMAFAYKMPETEKDVADLFKIQVGYADLVIIESVHSMTKQGVASSFKFGQNYGLLRGILIAYGFRFVEITPQKWQKKLGCLTKGDKNVSKAKAQQLFPRLKITHAIADALLIAEYGKLTYPKDPWEDL